MKRLETEVVLIPLCWELRTGISLFGVK
jgi:hypothetical protein